MTYLADESAHKLPQELYQFTVQGAFSRYTDSEVPVVHPITANMYAPEPISRGELQQSDEDSSMTVEVKVDALNPIAAFFRSPFLTARSVFILIERTHVGAVDAPAIVFRGQISQCVFEGSDAKFTCVPVRQAIQHSVPSVLVSSLCSNTLYDQRCQVNPATFQVTGVNISAVSGVVLTIPGHGKPDGYFSGGTITQSGLPAATIREQTGNTFKLLYNYGFTVGAAVTLLPGCDKRFTTCGGKFVNTIHFQGFPNMPVIDPFVDSVA